MANSSDSRSNSYRNISSWSSRIIESSQENLETYLDIPGPPHLLRPRQLGVPDRLHLSLLGHPALLPLLAELAEHAEVLERARRRLAAPSVLPEPRRLAGGPGEGLGRGPGASPRPSTRCRSTWQSTPRRSASRRTWQPPPAASPGEGRPWSSTWDRSTISARLLHFLRTKFWRWCLPLGVVGALGACLRCSSMQLAWPCWRQREHW